MKLLIISHTPHYAGDATISAWGPTVREIDHLARIFKQIVHLAPLHSGSVPGSSLAYTSPNIRLHLLHPAGGNSFFQKLAILFRIPGWLSAMRQEIRAADAIHIRCPAGISLVALLAVRLWGKKKFCWVKYAGNWGTTKDQPLSYRFQRWYLSHNFHHGIVTVNGQWQAQPPHVITFINPSFTEREYQSASAAARLKQLTSPVQLLFVGRLDSAKGADRVLQIAQQLKIKGIEFRLVLIGDSPEREAYEAFAIENQLMDVVSFKGWQLRSNLDPFYKQAHIILLPSVCSEGWPKVLSEAMAHGAVVIASSVSSIPQILTETGAGSAIPAHNIDEYVSEIVKYTEDVRYWKETSTNGVHAASNYTYEKYLLSVKTAFGKHCNNI